MSTSSRIVVAALVVLAGATGCRGAATTAGSRPAQVGSGQPGPSDGVSLALVAEGDALFNQGACVRCHGANGAGGANGPSLVAGPWLHGDGSMPFLTGIITTGVPRERLKDALRRFAMNPRGGPMQLTDDKVRALAAYVYSISRGKRKAEPGEDVY